MNLQALMKQAQSMQKNIMIIERKSKIGGASTSAPPIFSLRGQFGWGCYFMGVS